MTRVGTTDNYPARDVQIRRASYLNVSVQLSLVGDRRRGKRPAIQWLM